MDLTTLLIVLAVIVIGFIWFRRASAVDSRLPPFPVRPLPVVGNLLHMAQDSRPLFKKWKKQCGDIYSLYMGGTLVVVLNGYDLIKEALVKKADVFSDRPPYFMADIIGMANKGVIVSSGDNWKEQRHVTLSILRAFGMGKNQLAEKIQEEASCYIEYLASFKGRPTNIRAITSICTCNVICSIMSGQRFEYNDQDFQTLMTKLSDVLTDNDNVSLINFFSWLQYIPGDLFKAKQIALNMRAIIGHLKKLRDEKTRTVEDQSDVSNLIDAYMLERNKRLRDGLQTCLDEENLLKLLFDLFIGGTDTTSTTIYWCVVYLINYPDIQEKVYQEIKENVGTNRAPTIQDKTRLPYLNAVIAEILRLTSILPLSLTHMCSQETTLRGYTLPKGTYVIPNLDSVHFDKSTWGEDAMSFRPERFIDDNGKLEIPEQLIPFSIGRRICLGEAIAKMELFLFLAFMFQRFQFLPQKQGLLPSLEYVSGMLVTPRSYQVRMVERV